MTFSQILKTSPLAPREIEILVAFLLHKDREFLLTHPETIITLNIQKKLKKLIKQRLSGWSSAVLVGQKEFYGFTFKVDKNVLIPRPETEMMVTEILDLIKEENRHASIIDIGTGSGAIIIASANELKKTNLKQYKKTNFFALDVSARALKIAKENALRNKQTKKINFFWGNLLRPLMSNQTIQLTPRLIVTANLPYLTAHQVKLSPSIQKEPRLALIAGEGGLKYYRELFQQLKVFKTRKKTILSNNSLTVLCEIDPSQTIKIKSIIKKIFSGADIKIKKDLAGKDRLVVIKI